METEATKSWKLYKRLYTMAIKTYHCGRDDAADAAGHGICVALERGNYDFEYPAAAVKNFIFTKYRNRKRRGEDRSLSFYEDSDGEESIEMRWAGHPATQELRLVANECISAIDALPASTAEVMRLAALEGTADEIANELGIQKKEVYWRLQLGRKLLRQRDGYELAQKRGHGKYIGIRKDHHRWVASLRKGDEYFHLGYFSTASEAAMAYDAKAREINGEDARLNFPVAANKSR